MSVVTVFQILEKNRPDILGRMKAMRDQGSSFDDIAGYATREAGVTIGREMVRMYFKRVESEPTAAEEG